MSNKEGKSHKIYISIYFGIVFFLFLYLIRDYIVPLILAAVFAALMRPLYKRLVTWTKGKTNLSSALVTVLFLLIVIIPFLFLIIQIFNQALDLVQQMIPVLEEQVANPNQNTGLPEWFPYRDQLNPYKEQITQELGTILQSVGNFALSGLGSLTTSTVIFSIKLFVTLYAMFTIFPNSDKLEDFTYQSLAFTRIEFAKLKERGISIARATIKGALLIAIIQGALMGVAFAIIGIPGVLFWAAVCTLLSLIPSVGSGIVFVPMCIYLFMNGQQTAAIGLLLWGVLIVGTVDNFLRPQLVGRDTQMPDVLILISTLGGITMFGLTGFILGPLIAGMFITVMDVYSEVVD